MQFPTRLSAVAALVMLATPLAAQHAIDQQQTVQQGPFGYISDWNGQTFTAGAANISGAGFALTNWGSSSGGTATIELWSGVPSTAQSQQLASATGTFTLDPSSNSSIWFDLFWEPVAVNVGQTYWIGIGGGPGSVLTLHGDSHESYPTGGAWYNWSPTITESYGDFGGYDLTFRTYTDVTPPISAVPEPGTWALLGTGLAGLALVARRRRA